MKSFAPILAMLVLVSSASAQSFKAYGNNNNAVAITEAEEVSYMSLCHSEGAYLAHMVTYNIIIIRDWNYSTRTSLLKSRRRITKRVVVIRIRRVAVTR